MDALGIAAGLLSSRAGSLLLDIGHRLLYRDRVRKSLVRLIAQWLRAHLESNNDVHPTWRRIMRQRKLIYLAILHTLDRVVERRLLSPQVARVITGLWGRALCPSSERRSAARRFREEHGWNPPWFLVISPGHACNLHCPGCYADSGHGTTQLDWSILDRVITEAKELWGVPLFVFSGGEPLVYRSGGRDLLDIVERHADSLFLMFTNGTLIGREVAARLARLGNLTPALSVEGMRDRTDEHRGAGVFGRVLRAMDNLREVGVPFGVSVTATRANCADILSDEFLDFFFNEQGAFYGFVFQYMPIGRGRNLDWMPTSEQRMAFWRRSWEVVETKRLFLLDFWNHGPLVEGCISAGRDRGYMYIDWQGKVMPCVFAPYSAGNIREIYAKGGTLNDVWRSPFFEAIRQWQRGYGYGSQELSADNNWMRPCPFRDHYAQFREWIEHYQADPEDQAAAEVLRDERYYEEMVAYGTEDRKCSQAIWEEEYIRG